MPDEYLPQYRYRTPTPLQNTCLVNIHDNIVERRPDARQPQRNKQLHSGEWQGKVSVNTTNVVIQSINNQIENIQRPLLGNGPQTATEERVFYAVRVEKI
jgi:hypothetical protein